jgi:hypothetical protein
MPTKPTVEAIRRAPVARSRRSGHDSSTTNVGARNVIDDASASGR